DGVSYEDKFFAGIELLYKRSSHLKLLHLKLLHPNFAKEATGTCIANLPVNLDDTAFLPDLTQ
ncbi:MAG: hypothetical protein ACE5JU_18345, partial [Candidatus Binatia bacterium]